MSTFKIPFLPLDLTISDHLHYNFNQADLGCLNNFLTALIPSLLPFVSPRRIIFPFLKKYQISNLEVKMEVFTLLKKVEHSLSITKPHLSLSPFPIPPKPASAPFSSLNTVLSLSCPPHSSRCPPSPASTLFKTAAYLLPPPHFGLFLLEVVFVVQQ